MLCPEDKTENPVTNESREGRQIIAPCFSLGWTSEAITQEVPAGTTQPNDFRLQKCNQFRRLFETLILWLDNNKSLFPDPKFLWMILLKTVLETSLQKWVYWMNRFFSFKIIPDFCGGESLKDQSCFWFELCIFRIDLFFSWSPFWGVHQNYNFMI